MKKIFLIIIAILLLGCEDGPKAVFNEDFEAVGSRTAIPFENIVGIYKLDRDSKIRYNLPLNKELILDIKVDKSLIANDYLDSTWKLANKELKSVLLYYSTNTGTTISCPELQNGGGIDLYHRKSDNRIALYIYTPPLKGQEHGDYLRYIKEK